MMKQKHWRILLLLSLLVLAAVLSFYALSPANEGPPTLEPASTSSTVSSEPAFYLKNHQGKVAAFAANSTEPLEVLDVYVENLPEGDQAQLNSTGVPAADREALRRLIEDYGG